MVQKCVGNYESDPILILNTNLHFMKQLNGNEDKKFYGKKIFELGTGIEFVNPLGLAIAGADSITTVDIENLTDFNLFRQSCHKIVENFEKIKFDYEKNLRIDYDKIELINKHWDNPIKLLELLKINYLSPFDVTKIDSDNKDFDIYLSTNTLEHLKLEELRLMLRESKKILKPNGIHMHLVDLSDHYSHADQGILKINFLKFNDKQWSIISKNKFIYQNRLRLPDYTDLFIESGFKILKVVKEVDIKSLETLGKKFKIDNKFKNYNNFDLATTGAIIVAGS